MTDDVVAIHESGHALMATVLGFELLRVQVGDNPRYDLAPGPSRRLDRVRVLMGGGEAERVVFDREPIGTGSDDQQIADLLGPDDDEVALRDKVRRFLRLNAGTLRYLAVRLARCGVLTGDEVEQLVRGRKPFRADILDQRRQSHGPCLHLTEADIRPPNRWSGVDPNRSKPRTKSRSAASARTRSPDNALCCYHD
jgi:hypothetical protein